MDVINSYYQMHIGSRLKNWNLLKYILSPLDIISILLAFQCSYTLSNFDKGGLFFLDLNLLKVFFWILPFWLVILSLIKVTGIPTRRTKVLFFLYLQSSISIFFLLTLCNYLFKLDALPRMFLAGLSFFSFLFLFFGRILTYKILRKLGVKGYNHTNTIIIADETSVTFIDSLIARKELGYKAVVIFTESTLIKDRFENSTIILPEKFLGILNDLIKVDFIDEVLYLKEKPDSASFRDILRTCEDLGITVRLKSKDPRINLSSAIPTDIADGKFLSFINIPNNSYAMAISKTMDINIALLMIIVLLPILGVLSILIKLTSRGPIVCNFEKTGWRGQQIKVYRFRTRFSYEDKNIAGNLDIDSQHYEPVKDAKVTKIGLFLLMSGLDQLPQLFNVLKGEIPIIPQRHPLQKEE
jgi:hypothetical protein